MYKFGDPHRGWSERSFYNNDYNRVLVRVLLLSQESGLLHFTLDP